MITKTFKVGINGGIDESRVFSKDQCADAVAYARKLWEEFGGGDEDTGGCEANVYGYQEYSSDDKSPVSSRTYFWKHCTVDKMGRTSWK
jgi:hypothetical protein